VLTTTGWNWRGEWTWDDGGRPLAQRAGDDLRRWTYDRRGEPVLEEAFDVWIDDTGSHERLAARTRWHYDGRGELLARIETVGASEEPFREERFAYDARGRLVAHTRTGPAEQHQMRWTFGYDERGRAIDLSGARVSYDDARGIVTRVEPTGDRRTWFHRHGRVYRYEIAVSAGTTLIELQQDALGRTVAEDHVSVGNGRHSRWTWDWGPFGITREVRVRHGEERVTTWAYDGAGALVAYDDGRFSERTEYDAAGRIVHHTRDDGDSSLDSMSFDARFEWSDASELLTGETRRPAAGQREEWTWRNGVPSARAWIGLPPWGGRIDYDYTCLAQVFASMPRRRYREPARWRVTDVVDASPRHLCMTATDRNRFDPAVWTFRR
jgi:YD repeat-containing protein